MIQSGPQNSNDQTHYHPLDAEMYLKILHCCLVRDKAELRNFVTSKAAGELLEMQMCRMNKPPSS